MTHVLFAAHDTGGANVLKAAAPRARARGFRLSLMADGPARNAFDDLDGDHLDRPRDPAGLARIFAEADPAIVVTGTSVRSDFEREVWRAARPRGVPSLAVIDSWGNFGGRLGDGAAAAPTAVGVVDAWCRDEFLRSGLAGPRIYIVGNAHLETVGERIAAARRTRSENEMRAILFASHPVVDDWGGVAGIGFDEFTVADALIAALADKKPVRLIVKPHPRDDVAGWRAWRERSNPPGNVRVELGESASERWLAEVDGVVSMFSTVLIEAATAHIPALSLQPGRKYSVNPVFDWLPGVELVTEAEAIPSRVAEFIDRLGSGATDRAAAPTFAGSRDRLIAAIETEVAHRQGGRA